MKPDPRPDWCPTRLGDPTVDTDRRLTVREAQVATAVNLLVSLAAITAVVLDLIHWH